MRHVEDLIAFADADPEIRELKEALEAMRGAVSLIEGRINDRQRELCLIWVAEHGVVQ